MYPGAESGMGENTTYPVELRAVDANGKLFYSGADGVHGRELWVSDGTASGTNMVKDIFPGGAESMPDNLFAIGDTVYFRAFDGTHSASLWKSDGSAAGTALVKDFGFSVRHGTLGSFVVKNGELYFTDGFGNFWHSDGTTVGTQLVTNVMARTPYTGPTLALMGDTIYFSKLNSNARYELWKSDGTDIGTELVQAFDTTSLLIQNSIQAFTVLGNTLYFSADDGVDGIELWQTDGTPSGTTMTTNIHPQYGVNGPQQLTPVGDTLYFMDNDGSTGNELWKVDSASGVVSRLSDIKVGSGDWVTAILGH